jgi:hypothetical protein
LELKYYQGTFPESFVGCRQPAQPNLTQVREWFFDCLNNHPACSQKLNYALPTRVLEVKPLSRANSFEVRLLERGSSNEPYVTLSHRWGNRQPLQTTKENYETHLSGIMFDNLPKSFQDAVFTTQHLGVKHLWIDSLCIIQDSEEDWQAECARMAGIYANGMVTIAASDAEDATMGFLDIKYDSYGPQGECLGRSFHTLHTYVFFRRPHRR